MTRKAILMTLVAVGLVVAATSAAFGLYPAGWFGREAKPAPATVNMTVPTPVPTLPPSGMPNYRAIVQQAGPAVVGVTVAGLHKGSSEEFSIDPDDPFFQFFR